MTLIEWNALSEHERNTICAEKVMGITMEKLCTDGLEPGDLEKGYVPSVCFEGTGNEYKCNFFKDGGSWDTCEEKYSLPIADYVTDRNATALLLDKINGLAKPARIAFDDALYTATPRGEEWEYELNILRSSPSLLSYCAVTACEEET